MEPITQQPISSYENFFSQLIIFLKDHPEFVAIITGLGVIALFTMLRWASKFNSWAKKLTQINSDSLNIED